jgi:type 1 glutamine amidotransferase
MFMVHVLVLCDDLWHPAEVVKMGIRPLESEEFRFDFVMAAKDILTPERIAQYSVIICCKGNCVSAANTAPWFEEGVTEVGPKEFEEYVRKGGGFISLHSGNTSKQGEAYSEFVGNYFLRHPPRCGVDIEITASHPVTNGVKNFHIRDEHYQIVVMAQDAIELFRTRSDTGGDQVGGYARELGKGKLCVIIPGHTVDVWYHEEFKKLLTNAIQWCSHKAE